MLAHQDDPVDGYHFGPHSLGEFINRDVSGEEV